MERRYDIKDSSVFKISAALFVTLLKIRQKNLLVTHSALQSLQENLQTTESLASQGDIRADTNGLKQNFDQANQDFECLSQ